jgi:hypothetical protein
MSRDDMEPADYTQELEFRLAEAERRAGYERATRKAMERELAELRAAIWRLGMVYLPSRARWYTSAVDAARELARGPA